MKKASVLFFVSLTMMINLIFADNYITRGPAIGEIYFIGPTHTGMGIYYSINFGETAVCVDSIIANEAISIVADKTPGVLYYVTSQEKLFISYNFGQQGTWLQQNIGVTSGLRGGRYFGEIYASFYMQSDDFGENFYYHSCNGFYGGNKTSEIDNMNNIGYVFAYDPDISGIINVFYTDDNFENMEVINTFNFMSGEIIFATRGSNSGELYLFNRNRFELYYSKNFAETFHMNEYFNFVSDCYLSGGRIEGELYIVLWHINMAWQNAHTYILHSTDFGVTFEVFHPFSKGEEPLLANFSAIEKEVPITSSVDFSNFSIGDIQEYQWDFDDDGIIDSYDRIPVYTYADTGWYSVKLTIVGADSSNSFVKQHYIHVIDTTTGINEMQLNEFAIAPNPFMGQLTLTSNDRNESYSVFIYSLKGEKVFETSMQNSKSFTINTSEFDTGVYILNVVNKKTTANCKIIKK